MKKWGQLLLLCLYFYNFNFRYNLGSKVFPNANWFEIPFIPMENSFFAIHHHW